MSGADRAYRVPTVLLADDDLFGSGYIEAVLTAIHTDEAINNRKPIVDRFERELITRVIAVDSL